MTLPERPAKRWLTAPTITPDADRALSAYDPIIRQLLFNRNIHTAAEADAYLNAKPLVDDDPLQLAGMGEAVERIERAIAKREPIAIYGDYDTDGVTATALLVQVLTALGADAREYIPNRFEEGYGLNIKALSERKDSGIELVITVDCGIRSLAEAEHARQIGLDLIISDHHHVGDSLPNALAVINPKRHDDRYPYRDFAGVGLAYKIAQALVRRRTPPPINGSEVLDLVALGTVSDLAPLTGENRALVRKGLGVLNKAKREGVKSLLIVSRLKPGGVDAGNIGFSLGPRLNAAGRLESARAAYRLLVTNDVWEANELAGQLEQQNRERQELTKQITAQARDLAVPDENNVPPFLFAAHEGFSPGVVGLAAARLCEEFYRPAAVASIGDSETKGSARSIKEFHVTEALDSCANLLVRHGGHAAAAGFTVANEHVDALADHLQRYAADRLVGEDLRPALRIDMAVPPRDITLELAQSLKQLEPCGYGNPSPVFAAYGLEPKNAKVIGGDGTHLRLYLSDGTRTVEAIAFKQAHWLKDMPKRMDVVYSIEINEWQGEQRLQMNVKDMRKSIVD
ncbi:MAG TPA: single-stranded-DNA-specific exonuclease RecJ [Anaerolineales bacterium]|nr:single-stranded-DNA-specific exonuclease RecJ [Anaerolineales bacterium]